MNLLRITACVSAAVFMITPLASCSKKNKTDLTPLMGLTWFEAKADVMDELQHLTFVNEREKDDESAKQYYVDYEDASLLDNECTLTVCFTDQGFVGLNYHDLNRMNTYRQWYTALEDIYGSATEQGSGMASWYENPVGKNTAVYLFNLEEGVQVSFYATGDSPDRDYKKEKGDKPNYDLLIPAPEIRTPVVAVEDEVVYTNAVQNNLIEADTNIVYTNEEGILVTDIVVKDENGEAVVDEEGETVVTAVPVVTTIVTDVKGKEITTEVTNAKGKPVIEVTTSTKEENIVTTTVTTNINSAATNITETTEPETQPVTTTTVIVDHTKDFLPNGLSFYNSANRGRAKMSDYSQSYEYRIEEPGEPWELIMEYERVRYLGRRCDVVLCFTSLGLVGMNYYDSNANNYDYWIQKLTDIYGISSETQSDYTVWYDDPVGNGTMIYVLALDDGVQISFFADDTGSELAK